MRLINARFHELRHNRIHRVFGLLHANARCGHGQQVERRRIQRGAPIPGGGIDRVLVLKLQLLAQHRGLPAAQKLRQQSQRRRAALITGVAFWCEVRAGHIGLRHACIIKFHPPRAGLRWLTGPRPFWQVRIGRDHTVIRLRQRFDLVWLHVTGDNQDCVVGCIIGPVVFERILKIESLHLVPPAYDRNAIAVVEVLRRVELLAEKGAWIILHPLIALLDDDIALGQDLLLTKADIDHPVALHCHHQLKPVRGHPLVIRCHIIAGEGIVPSAIGRHGCGKLARLQLVGAFEQQMLQKMRHPGHAGFLIGRACLVPHHMHDNRRTVILDHHHLHAVFQHEIGDLILRLRRQRHRRPHRKRADNASQHKAISSKRASTNSYAPDGALQGNIRICERSWAHSCPMYQLTGAAGVRAPARFQRHHSSR
mmetsp:Transcript_7085/g.11546  ORF Transcript_7085/g.11546 Transcript_7085/m.11546 type:complete len:424 (-) Transcript_7085:2404-3675(-)